MIMMTCQGEDILVAYVLENSAVFSHTVVSTTSTAQNAEGTSNLYDGFGNRVCYVLYSNRHHKKVLFLYKAPVSCCPIDSFYYYYVLIVVSFLYEYNFTFS